MTFWMLAAVFIGPLLMSMVDLVPISAARKAKGYAITEDTPSVDDFVVLVPIYGSVRYLENVAYLAQYGERVWLCTTTNEAPEFYEALEAIATERGFRIFRGYVPPAAAGSGSVRNVAGTIRDRLVRDASSRVEAEYVICIDADTETEQPLGLLVGAIAVNGFDLVSVRLVPSNRNTMLARMQGHEYRMAMRLRRVLPWLISGACHGGRTSVHRAVMQRHSLFFQANDAELGLLAHAMGYRVGHVLFDVPTIVPHLFWPWWRQRLAWAGGEFRLFVMNVWLLPKHWFAFSYGLLFVILLFPFRWAAIVHPSLSLVAVFVVYMLAMLAVNWRDRDVALLLMPVYGLFITLFLAPFALVWYVRMALADHNAGIIRPGRAPQVGPTMPDQPQLVP